MIKKMKEYAKYRKNVKVAMRGFTNLATALWGALKELTALLSDTERILELLRYMAKLTPEEIRRILTHAAVKTIPDGSGINTNQIKGR